LTRTRNGSPFRDQWEVVPKAVTAAVGEEVTFTHFPRGGGDVYDGLRDTGRGGRGIQTRVTTTTIDAEWKARGSPPVSLVKVDVEGGEVGVLAGAADCLQACRPVVVTEWCPRNFAAYGHKSGAMLDAAAAAGYDVFVIPELSPVTDLRLFDLQLATRENLLLLPRP
jgi:FkbM family methyltransferase